MKKINILLLIPLLLLLLHGCGSNPTSSNKGSVTLSVNFPSQTTAGGPAALISASTSYFNVWVWDSAFNLIGMSVINAPAGGGVVTTTILLNPYTGPGYIEVWGYKANGMGNSYMLNTINILPQNNPAAVTVVEMGQGVALPVGAGGSTLISPDGVIYPINNLFLDTTDVVGTQGWYKLGIQVTNPQTASAAYFQSSNNIDQFKSIIKQAYIYDGLTDYDIDVPNASRTVWNRYHFTIDFNSPAGPTNTPTIQATFKGTLTFDLFQNVVPAASPAVGAWATPGASGTVTLNLSNASWSNNVAPPPNNQPIIMLYTQPQQGTIHPLRLKH